MSLDRIRSALGRAVVATIGSALAKLEHLPPAEQDSIINALVADLRARRPMSVSPLSVLPPPSDPIAIRDPRTVQP